MSKRKVPDSKTLKKLYLTKRLSSYDITEMYNVKPKNVCIQLRKLGIIRPDSGPNLRNRNFKIKVYRSGYPVTFLPDHPRANHLGYVYDHVLEISKKFGYIPTPKTTIHHIDLDKKNSNIDNLYLTKNVEEHRAIHSQLYKMMSQIIKEGIVVFKNGKYQKANALTVPLVKYVAENLS